MSNRSRCGLILLGLLVGLLLAEGLSRLYLSFVVEPTHKLANAELEIEPFVYDARLGARGNPAYPGNDSRGWRNAAALNRADIVALGDSQTYGYDPSAPFARDAAWPQVLGGLLLRSVYQMALGGYGPAQYLLLSDEAIALHPKVILAAYYLGNDNLDAYWRAYQLTGGVPRVSVTDPALASFVSRDPMVRASIKRAEAIDPGVLRQDYVECNNVLSVPDPNLQRVHNILAAPLLSPLSRKSRTMGPPVRSNPSTVLQQWSMLFRVSRNLYRRLHPRFEAPSPAKDYGSPICVHYRDRSVSTVLTPGYRLLALDKTDPRVAEGERISLLAYRTFAERCHRAGVKFYVVIIPTKELVFRARAEASLRNEPYLVDEWNAEEGNRSDTFMFFNRVGVDVIDTLSALQDVLASGTNPYLQTYDGHPTKPGYAAIARAVADRLRRDKVFEMH